MAGDAVCQMRPDNTGIKSGYLQNNFRIDKNAHDVPFRGSFMVQKNY
jgi:hypothetical protein